MGPGRRGSTPPAGCPGRHGSPATEAVTWRRPGGCGRWCGRRRRRRSGRSGPTGCRRRAPITGSGPSASPPWARRPRCEPGCAPGTPWRGADYWTPATASFALAAMAAGDRVDADQRLDWLLDHRTALGAFPERVRRGDGAPRSAAPLAWTDAIVLLTLASGDRPLPIPGT